MIYVLPLHKTWPSKKWPFKCRCFLVADSRQELIEFATQKLGLRHQWLQEGKRPHFFLSADNREKALAMGAQGVE